MQTDDYLRLSIADANETQACATRIAILTMNVELQFSVIITLMYNYANEMYVNVILRVR